MNEENKFSVPQTAVDNLSEYFANSCDGFFLLNEFLEICHANATMQSWTGMQESAVEHYNFLDVVGFGDGKELFMQHCRLAFTGIPSRFEFLLHSPNNEPRWLEISLQRIPNAKLLGIAREIGEYKQEIIRLQYKLNRDELTGLLNRSEFIRVVNRAPSRSPGLRRALFVIELEHFNVVNDICGQAAGDKLLCLVADSLRLILGAKDIAARLGGKKFAVLCMDSDVNLAYTKARVIRDRLLAIQLEYDSSKYKIGVRIGISLVRDQSDSLPEDFQYSALSEAESACHFAGNMGHNRIHAYSHSGNNAYRHQESEWISRISSAFENERFQLYYQNIQQIENGCEKDDHHEILLRMLDENGEHVTPEEFIPAAEKYHMMPLIDRWVIRTMFARNAGIWRTAFKLQQDDAGLPMSLCCINISGASLNDDYFLEFLRDQVALYKVPPQAVCFELTETVAVKDLEKASWLIKALRADGFRFALDDFGKGMSSFSYLQSLPVDFLKIDGSLVQNIDINKIDLCMVEAIHRIAQQMGIKTIAEYVKNQRVIEMLQAMGVNYVQGFGIHHPEPLL